MNKKSSIDISTMEPNNAAENKLKYDLSICKKESEMVSIYDSDSDTHISNLSQRVSVKK